MVVVDVFELEILNGVEFDGEEMVGGVSDVLVVEEAEILTGESVLRWFLILGGAPAMAGSGGGRTRYKQVFQT